MPPALGAQNLNHWTTREVSMNHFKVYNSMVFSTFTMLGNHPLYLVPELFFTPERNSDLIKSLLPVYLFSQLLETTVSCVLTEVLHINKCTHTEHSLLSMASLT